MITPEAFIRFTPGLITDDGVVTNESTDRFLRRFMVEFHRFIAERSLALPATFESATA